MPASTSSATYGPVAKFLHWLIAIAIIAMLAIGWTMGSLPMGHDKIALIQLHKSIGITILLLSLFRLGWRLKHTAPPLPDHMATWEKIAAEATHVAFYVLIIGMPLTGWVMVSASPLNVPTVLYGFIPWPHLPILPELENKKEISHIFNRMHGIAAYIVAALLVLHIAAAQKHHWIDRDDVLTRMAPGPIARLLNRLRGTR